MKINFSNFINIVLTTSDNTRRNELVFDYAQKQIVAQNRFQNNRLVKTVHSNGFTNFSHKTGKSVWTFFDNARSTISHVFDENSGKLERLVKRDKIVNSGYYAEFGNNGELKSVAILDAEKKSTYILNEEGNVVNIRGKKPDLKGDLSIKYNPDSDDIEFVEKIRQPFYAMFQVVKNYYKDNFGCNLIKQVRKQVLNSESKVITDVTRYAVKDGRTYKSEIITYDSTAIQPSIYEIFNSSGFPVFTYCVGKRYKTPQPQHFVLPDRHNLSDKPVDVSKLFKRNYFELIIDKNFLKKRIKYSNTMNK